MPCEDCPDDDKVRQTYNFAPGSFGVVYRADVPDYGAGPRKGQQEQEENDAKGEIKAEAIESDEMETDLSSSQKSETRYKLQAMKW
jgi:hypothetical protein